jgi:hypothetical protein
MARLTTLMLLSIVGGSALVVVPARWVPSMRLTLPSISACAPDLDGSEEGDSDIPAVPSAFNPSRELERYKTTRFRLTQSGPIRRGIGAIDDGLGAFRGLVQFYLGAVSAISIHRALLVLTLLAFGLQQ